MSRSHMKLLPMVGTNPSSQLRFQCTEDDCGDIVGANRILKHAMEAHGTSEVEVSATSVWKKLPALQLD